MYAGLLLEKKNELHHIAKLDKKVERNIKFQRSRLPVFGPVVWVRTFDRLLKRRITYYILNLYIYLLKLKQPSSQSLAYLLHVNFFVTTTRLKYNPFVTKFFSYISLGILLRHLHKALGVWVQFLL